MEIQILKLIKLYSIDLVFAETKAIWRYEHLEEKNIYDFNFQGYQFFKNTFYL